MKNLMKLLSMVIVLTMTNESSAQKFGVKAGLNLSNLYIKGESNDDFKNKSGFHIGGTAEFQLKGKLSFETGLLLTSKGVKMVENMGKEKYKFKLNLYYLDIPLTAKATFNAGKAKIYGAFGPYVGIGLKGKYKMQSTYNGKKEAMTGEVDMGPDKENDAFKRLDYGLTAGAGIEINAVQLGVCYNFGLANIAHGSGADSQINNRVLSLSVGYRFGRNR